MAKYPIKSEKMVKCPFNPLHILPENSLQRHIIRCMKNHPNYVTCPYNALHRFKNTDILRDHMLECNSREKIHLFYETIESVEVESKANVTCFHIDNTRSFNLQEENWDDD